MGRMRLFELTAISLAAGLYCYAEEKPAAALPVLASKDGDYIPLMNSFQRIRSGSAGNYAKCAMAFSCSSG